MNIDHRITCAIHNQAHKRPWLDRLAIFTARDLPFVFVLLPSLFFSRLFFYGYLFGLVLVLPLVYLFQRLVHRRRPFQSEHLHPIFRARIPSPSFPSGHATLVASVITFVIAWRGPFHAALLTTMVVLGFFILLARVYGGLHYVSDILAGLLFGVVVTYLLFFSGFL